MASSRRSTQTKRATSRSPARATLSAMPEGGPSTSAYISELTWKENGKTVHSPGSNFWTTEDGFNVEVQFQAEKHSGHPMRQKIIRAIGEESGPWAAKKKAREWRLTQDER